MSSIPFRMTRNRTTTACAVAFFAVCIGFTAWQEPLLEQRCFVLALMLCVFGVAYFLFARVAFALALSGGLFLLLRAITVLKQEYLESPLMPADFVYYVRSSLFETLRRYPNLYSVGICVGIAVPIVLWLSWHCDRRRFARLRALPQSLLRLGGIAFCASAFWICLLPSGPFAKVHDRGTWEK